MQCIGKGEHGSLFPMHCIRKKEGDGIMESPKVYRGYNKEGTCVVSKTAVDANTLLNPAEVQAAIENVKDVFSAQMKAVAQALKDISNDAEEAVIVQGTNMGGTIDDVCSLLLTLSDKITSGIESLYDTAVKVHDELQRNENNKAYNACAVSGVVSIS